jgi:hypothetical protein
LINIPKEKGFEVVFYQEGQRLSRDTKMAAINRPVTWSIEKAVLYDLFKNFSRFWGTFGRILKEEEKIKVPEAMPTAGVEAPIEQEIDKFVDESEGRPEEQEGIEKEEIPSTEEINDQPVEESLSKDSTKVVGIQDVIEKSETEVKKRKDFRRDRLDYFI